jgi:hypothetical protein
MVVDVVGSGGGATVDGGTVVGVGCTGGGATVVDVGCIGGGATVVLVVRVVGLVV